MVEDGMRSVWGGTSFHRSAIEYIEPYDVRVYVVGTLGTTAVTSQIPDIATVHPLSMTETAVVQKGDGLRAMCHCLR